MFCLFVGSIEEVRQPKDKGSQHKWKKRTMSTSKFKVSHVTSKEEASKTKNFSQGFSVRHQFHGGEGKNSNKTM